MGASLYIPGTHEAVLDGVATMPLTQKSAGDEACENMDGVRTGGPKRVSWEATQKQRAKMQRHEEETARLLVQQKANAALSAARFTPPHTYNARLSREIGNINGGMPQSTCRSTCMVEGVCNCSAQGRR